jgi:hypothetical protein
LSHDPRDLDVLACSKFLSDGRRPVLPDLACAMSYVRTLFRHFDGILSGLHATHYLLDVEKDLMSLGSFLFERGYFMDLFSVIIFNAGVAF